MSDSVLTLADLDNWSFAGTALAVLGHPIKHSISPAMHNAALAEMARTEPRYGSWQYFRFEVHPDDLPEALRRLHARGFHGLNLTVPHKVIAFDQVLAVDPAARPIGAVNTLRREGAGWRGFNTDGHGLAAGLRDDLGLDLHGAPVLLLGAGGAARGAAVECLQRGCAALWIANRTAANLASLLSTLSAVGGEIPVAGFSPDAPPAGLPTGLVVINATSAGLRESDAPPIVLEKLPRPAGVYDMIYNPPRTVLLQAAVDLGLPTANGLSMLVHQGARSLGIWSGAAVPVATMQQAARRALGR